MTAVILRLDDCVPRRSHASHHGLASDDFRYQSILVRALSRGHAANFCHDTIFSAHAVPRLIFGQLRSRGISRIFLFITPISADAA